MPDDAALTAVHMFLRGLDAKILVYARQLFHATIEQHKVVHQLNQPLLIAHLEQVFIQLVAAVVRLVLFPLQKIFFLCLDRAVLHPLGIITRKDKLYRAEKPLVEFRLLVGNVLADAITYRNAAVLQLQHTHSDAVNVKHQVRSPFVVAVQGHLLGNGKIILRRAVPVNQLDRIGVLACYGLHRHTVAQQAINFLVVVV